MVFKERATPSVSIQAYRRVQQDYTELAEKYETLRKLLQGQWVDTQAVQEALDIDFAEGMRLFDFGRIVKWNKAPLNGQKVITKFRLCEKTVEQLGVFPFEPEDS